MIYFHSLACESSFCSCFCNKSDELICESIHSITIRYLLEVCYFLVFPVGIRASQPDDIVGRGMDIMLVSIVTVH